MTLTTVTLLFCLIFAASCQFIGPNDYYFDMANDYDHYSLNNFYNTKSADESGNDNMGMSTSKDIVCRDEITGEPIDWVTLYKLPRNSKIEEYSPVTNPFVYEGTAYTYMTNVKQDKWHMSELSMNDTKSFAGRTLDVLFETFDKREFNLTAAEEAGIGYILYNDQADKVSLSRGHTKGVIMFNNNSAIWIVHSIPHFPPKPSDSKYQIHHGQCVYGQQFFCMSLKPSDLEKIGQQFQYTYPQVYDSFIPQTATNSAYLENLINVLNGHHVKSEPWSNLNTFETVGGERLLSFAKFTDFGDDLYSRLVAPELKSGLLTETWNNGRGTLESNCSIDIQFQVHNIEQVNFRDMGVRFSVHHDHSKWAVTSDKKLNNRFGGESVQVACIGDINRQEEQFKRAGGTVCFLHNNNVWSQYSKLVAQIEPCKKPLTKLVPSEKKTKRFGKTQGRTFKFEKNTSDRIKMLG